MDGPEGAAERVAGRLEARIPARLRMLETRLNLDTGALADPALVAAHETGPLGVEEWPAVYVLPQRLEELRLVDVVDRMEIYRASYAVRVVVWCRAGDYGDTDRLRKRYVLAVRESLLELKSLTALASTDGTEAEVAVAPSTIREDYSDVFTDEAQRTIAGAWLDFTVTAVETIATTTVGDADTVVVGIGDTVDVPPHPAL